MSALKEVLARTRDGEIVVINFHLGDTVKIDEQICGTVIAICVYLHDIQAQVSWWNDGVLLTAWVSEWRLTRC